MPITIFLARHGETEHNVSNVVQGQTFDSPLTEKGVNDAISIGEHIEKISQSETKNPENLVIYSSDLGRAVATTEIVSKYLSGCQSGYLSENKVNINQIIIDDRLRERALGAQEGLLNSIKKKDARLHQISNNIDYLPPLSENNGNVINRVELFFKDLYGKIKKREIKNSSILIITHQGVLHTIKKRKLLDRAPLSIKFCWIDRI